MLGELDGQPVGLVVGLGEIVGDGGAELFGSEGSIIVASDESLLSFSICFCLPSFAFLLEPAATPIMINITITIATPNFFKQLDHLPALGS